MEWQIKVCNLWVKSEGLCAAKSWWKSCNPLYHTNCKAWRRLCYGVGGFHQLQNWGFVPGEEQIKSDRLSQHTAASHNPIWNAGCVSRVCTHKIMTQSIPVNTARGTLKAKSNSMSFNWCIGRHNQRTCIPLNRCEMNLTDKSELKQPTSATRLWQLLQESWAKLSSVNQSSVKRMLRICEAVIAAKGGHFDELKV